MKTPQKLLEGALIVIVFAFLFWVAVKGPSFEITFGRQKSQEMGGSFQRCTPSLKVGDIQMDCRSRWPRRDEPPADDDDDNGYSFGWIGGLGGDD